MKKYILRFWKPNLLIFGILVITNVCLTLVSVIMASSLNALVDLNFTLFFETLLANAVIFMIYLFFSYILINKKSQTKQKMATAIRTDVTKRMEQTSYSNFHTKPVGTYASWLSNDLNTIETVAFDQFYTVLGGMISAVSSIIAMFIFHWSIVLLTLAVTIVTILLPMLYQKVLSLVSLLVTEESERFLSKVTDTLNGFDTFFSFNLLEKITKDMEEASLKLADVKNKQAKVIAKVALLGTFGNIVGQLSIMGLTGYLVSQSIVSVGSILATGELAGTIFNTVGNISQQIAAIRSVEPVFKKLETIEPSVEKSTEKIKIIDSGIVLDNLSYAYDDKLVLNNLDFSFQLGGKYAIVGASGSGKTTLLNILNGKLMDYDGSVQFAGKELSVLSGRELREHILYMDQIPYLFEGTVRENITLDEDFSNEQIQQALKASNLDEVVRNLPQGIDTDIGDAGRLLSGGQRQRVALARGLVRGKKIILLDEGTSSLDEKSALEIEKQLIENEELTVLMITHQLRESIQKQLNQVILLS